MISQISTFFSFCSFMVHMHLFVLVIKLFHRFILDTFFAFSNIIVNDPIVLFPFFSSISKCYFQAHILKVIFFLLCLIWKFGKLIIKWAGQSLIKTNWRRMRSKTKLHINFEMKKKKQNKVQGAQNIWNTVLYAAQTKFRREMFYKYNKLLKL